EPHLESRIGALQPVVQPVGVAVHGGPALQWKIGDEKDAGHKKRMRGAWCVVADGARSPDASLVLTSDRTTHHAPRICRSHHAPGASPSGSTHKLPPKLQGPLRNSVIRKEAHRACPRGRRQGAALV